MANFAFNDKYEGSMCHRKAKVRTLRAFRTKESDGGREDSKGESRRTGGECRDKKKSKAETRPGAGILRGPGEPRDTHVSPTPFHRLKYPRTIRHPELQLLQIRSVRATALLIESHTDSRTACLRFSLCSFRGLVQMVFLWYWRTSKQTRGRR